MSFWQRRRRQRRNEEFIWRYPFPEWIEERCRHHHPDLTHDEWKLIEQGLREWFLCCAWRDGEVLGMPSQLVDEAWHEFILDSRAYAAFCEEAFGKYLHHTPESSMSTPMAGALDQTAKAWDRAGGEDRGDSILWRLDALIGGWAASGEVGGGHHHHGGGGESSSGGEGGGGGDSGSGGGGCGGGGSDSGGGGGGGCGGGN
jgi:hypothetical protein